MNQDMCVLTYTNANCSNIYYNNCKHNNTLSQRKFSDRLQSPYSTNGEKGNILT